MIKEAFYELHHHPGEYGRISAEQAIIKKELREDALAELKTADPEISRKQRSAKGSP